jgi:hypothetical protein
MLIDLLARRIKVAIMRVVGSAISQFIDVNILHPI